MAESTYRELRVGSLVVVVEAGLEAATREAGLLEPGAVERLTAAGSEREGRTRTARVALPGTSRSLLLRPVVHGGWLAPVLGGVLAGLGRPLGELSVSAELRRVGAPVAHVALVIGRRRAGPLWTATVGSFWEERTLDALAFLETRPSARRLHRAAAAAGDAVSRFHRAGGRHPDLHLKNLLLRERGAGFEAIVVDLDRVRCAARVGPARRMAELMRLYRSLLKRGVLQQVGVRGCAAFFHAYVAGDRELRHALLRRLPRERRRVAMHALLYRARP